MRIACIGDNCIDCYEGSGMAFPGGNAVNAAVYIKRLGGDASYVGAVGSDEHGGLLLSALQKKGVDVSRVRVCEGSTAVSHVTIVNGDRIFGEYDEGVMAVFRPSEEDVDFLCAHDLVVTSLWGHSECALESIRARGVLTAFDASESPYAEAAKLALPHSDVFFFSDDRSGVPELENKLRALKTDCPGVVVVMRGGAGSMAFDGTKFFMQGIVPCAVVDTIGAGDSFIAGFILAWLGGETIPDCMAAGAKNAAVTIGYSGAW